MYINYLSDWLKKEYGCKVYKLALSSGCTCPNRDGTISNGGCIFCDGAGAFASTGDIETQIRDAKQRIAAKLPKDKKGKINAAYIAYFQSFTNTYGNVKELFELYKKAVSDKEIVALSIATRPDCISDDIMEMLMMLNIIKPVWIELGLQTIHEDTARYINRGYDLSVYNEALEKLKKAKLKVIVHQIIGLPYETKEMILDTTRYIGQSGADGIKLHLLHVLKDTKLATDWEQGKLKILELEEYIDIVKSCIGVLPRSVVIHRLTGDGPKQTLLAPEWSKNKKKVLNTMNKAFRDCDIKQGSAAID